MHAPTPAAGGGGFDRPPPGDASPVLSERQIALLEPFGHRRRVRGGDVLFRVGDTEYDFHVVIDGLVAIVDEHDDGERTLVTHGPGEFVGDLALLTGGVAFAAAVVARPGELLRVPAARLREVMEDEPVLPELIVHALLVRRGLLIRDRGGVEIIGSPAARDTQRLRRYLRRNNVPHAVSDSRRDARALDRLTRAGATPEQMPVVLLSPRRSMANPPTSELARALGLAGGVPRTETYDLVIVGSGPAGLAASMYAAADGLSAATVEALATGGQAGTSPRIENYLGFPAGVSGAELTQRALLQAVKFGAEFLLSRAAVALGPAASGDHVVTLDDGAQLVARAVIAATGAT